MAIPIPGDVRQILDAPNYVHLSTLRADGSLRNWVVWVGSRTTTSLCAPLMRSGRRKTCAAIPGVALSVTDIANPYGRDSGPGGGSTS
jgi:hypothetical protein